MFIAPPEDSDDTARIYKASKESQGFVMNLTRAWAWRPDVFEAFAALRVQLTSKSSLSKREQAVMVCAMATELGDSYCALAWGKVLTQETNPSSAAALIGSATADRLTVRDQALAAWARKLVADPNGTSRQDVDALRAAGLSEKEIFEATVFIGFRLAFSTVNDALGAVPDRQLVESLPPEVAAAVTFGRPADSASSSSR
jgi:uncharacterized peroxidase-related enzyme